MGDADTGMADACEGLECRVVQCERQGKTPTTISGTVFAPNRTLPLYGAIVYVPNGEVAPLTDGAQCQQCDQFIPGNALAYVITGPDGKFTLPNVPSGRNVPVVIQLGKWRRQITIADVIECQETQLPPADTALPRNSMEGDMPKIAMATGSCDALECLPRKLGISDTEFTAPTGPGRIHMYASNGVSRFTDNTAFGTATSLWGNLDELKKYDIVMFGCECSQNAGAKPQAAMDALKAYADLGGRVFLSHYHSVWIGGETGNPTHAPAVWPQIAQCDIDGYDAVSGTIDTVNNPKGGDFQTWMTNVQGSPTPGQIPITEARQTCRSVDTTKGERWVYVQSSGQPQIFQFTTPNEVVKEQRCGKVVFSDMHVSGTSSSSGAFPTSCSTADLSPQEKALAFMFFDIASCVGVIGKLEE